MRAGPISKGFPSTLWLRTFFLARRKSAQKVPINITDRKGVGLLTYVLALNFDDVQPTATIMATF